MMTYVFPGGELLAERDCRCPSFHQPLRPREYVHASGGIDFHCLWCEASGAYAPDEKWFGGGPPQLRQIRRHRPRSRTGVGAELHQHGVNRRASPGCQPLPSPGTWSATKRESHAGMSGRAALILVAAEAVRRGLDGARKGIGHESAGELVLPECQETALAVE